ncbi:MAG: hypothetical protein JSS14_18370 [Proteobacteria bacterium]|nr:hypothetical protein [Pseudomonadota bacterium]
MTSRLQRLAVLASVAVAGASLSAACAIAAQPASTQPLVVSAQKPNGSGVELRYRVLDTPALGQPARVEIVLGKIKDPSGATVRFTADPTLRLASGGTQATLPPGETTTLTVTVVPQEEGLAYLNVFTSQNGLISSTSIPIQAGAATPASKKMGAGKLKDTPEGEKILVMPVK